MDGSVFRADGLGGFGAIIRDSGGKVMVVFSGILRESRSPFLVELLACRDALQYLVSHLSGLGFVEVDALLVQKALSSAALDI